VEEEGEETFAQGVNFTDMTLEEIEKIIVTRAVENVGGNKSEAARRLGITRKTLVTKMQG
jgi:two-component system response regulator HydG